MKKLLLSKQFSLEGVPLVGYPVEVLTSGGSPAPLYASETSPVKMDNNVVLTDSLGRASAYVEIGGNYRMILRDKTGQTLKTTDVFQPSVNGDPTGKLRPSPLALVYSDLVDPAVVEVRATPNEVTLILRAVSETNWVINPAVPAIEGSIIRVIAQGATLTGPNGVSIPIGLGFYLGVSFRYYEGVWTPMYSRVSTDPNYVFDPGPI